MIEGNKKDCSNCKHHQAWYDDMDDWKAYDGCTCNHSEVIEQYNKYDGCAGMPEEEINLCEFYEND